MEIPTVQSLMIPILDYATVRESCSLREAVLALEAAQENYDSMQKSAGRHRYKHRAVVVLNEKSQVVGKLSMWDIIKALEPNYDQIGDFSSMTKFGFNLQEVLMSYLCTIAKSKGDHSVSIWVRDVQAHIKIL